MSDKELTEQMRQIRLGLIALQSELPDLKSFGDELHNRYNKLADSIDRLAGRMSAMSLIDLETVCRYSGGEWRSINSINDAPADNCPVVYTTTDEEIPGENLSDPANISASVGFLMWNRERNFWTIHDCGEVVHPNEVSALCPIPRATGVVAGTGAVFKAQ